MLASSIQPINKRLNWHKSDFLHSKKHRHYRVLCEHFNEELWQGEKYKVEIVEKLEGGSRTSRKTIKDDLSIQLE